MSKVFDYYNDRYQIYCDECDNLIPVSDEYKRIEAFHRNKLKQKEREKKLAGIAASKDLERRKTASRDKWQKDYSTWTSPSGRDHVTTGGIGSPESKKGPAGGSIGASRFLARGGRASYFNGGLASLWRR